MSQSQFALEKFERQERERIRTGGPAFPCSNEEDVQYNWLEKGMTLRDWFAGQALAGLIKGNDPQFAVRQAYHVADLMLAERDNG